MIDWKDKPKRMAELERIENAIEDCNTKEMSRILRELLEYRNVVQALRYRDALRLACKWIATVGEHEWSAEKLEEHFLREADNV